MNSRTLRAVFAAVMTAAGIVLLLQAYSEERGIAAGANFSPLFYPKIILWCWIGLAGGMLVQSLWFLRDQARLAVNWFPLLSGAALIGLLCWLMPLVGFLPVCMVFMAAFPACLGYRKPVPLLITAVVFSAGVWYVFNNFLDIPLPEMPFFEEEF